MTKLRPTSKESLSVQHRAPKRKAKPGMVWCDTEEGVIRARDCAVKHHSAVRLRERDERQGKPAKFNPCRCCPTGIEQALIMGFSSETRAANNETNQAKTETKQEATVTTANKKLIETSSRQYQPGPCPQCGENRRVFRKKQMCSVCAAKARNTGPLDRPRVKEAQAMLEKEIAAHEIKANILEGPSHVCCVPLPDSLYKLVAGLAEQEFRTIEKQILWELKKSVSWSRPDTLP